MKLSSQTDEICAMLLEQASAERSERSAIKIKVDYLITLKNTDGAQTHVKLQKNCAVYVMDVMVVYRKCKI